MALGSSLFINPTITVFDNLGNPASSGTIGFYTAANHAIKKSIFQDADLTIEWENPIPLNSIGQPELQNTLIYLASDEPYYVEFKDQYGTVLNDYNDYPYPTSLNPDINDQNIWNFVPNPAFAVTYQLPVIIPASKIQIAPGNWWFYKNNISATDSMSFINFVPGQDTVPGNPINQFNYNCIVAGSSETIKTVYIKYDNVETFSDTIITVDLYMSSPTESDVDLVATQVFGEGGSADSVTVATTFELNATMSNYRATFTVPSVSGLTIGDGSYLSIGINLPTNAVCNFSLGPMAIYEGEQTVIYKEVPTDLIKNKSLGSQYPILTTSLLEEFNPDDGEYELIFPKGRQADGTYKAIWRSKAGRVITWASNTVPDGTLPCNGNEIWSSDYYNLCNVLSTQFGIGVQGFYSSSNKGIFIYANNTSEVVGVQQGDISSGIPYYFVTNGVSTYYNATWFIFGKQASEIIPGGYFIISHPGVSQTNYYVWFKVNGVGTSPAISTYTGIEIDLVGTETADEVNTLIKNALVATTNFGSNSTVGAGLSVYCSSNGVITAPEDFNTGFVITLNSIGETSVKASFNITVNNTDIDGKYFFINSPTTQYCVYYSLNNQTPHPNVSGKKFIKVIYLESDTESDIAALTAVQLYNATVITPTTQGLFIRGWGATGSEYDPDTNSRIMVPGSISSGMGNNIGSYQQNQNLSHYHAFSLTSSGSAGTIGTPNFTGNSQAGYIYNGTTTGVGGNQSNPNNIYMRYVITY